MATNNPLNMIDDLLELKIGESMDVECLGYADVDQGKVLIERVADNTVDYDLDDDEDGVPQFTVTIFEYDDEDGRLLIIKDVLDDFMSWFPLDEEDSQVFIKNWFEETFNVKVKYIQS